MRDGRTRRLASQNPDLSFAEHRRRWRATVAVVEGPTAGVEIPIDREQLTLGRGPGTDFDFEDDAMSRQHAALEFTGEGFRVRDLGSMNGVLLEGAPVQVADLKHGDRFRLGEHVFRFLLEERPREPRTYVLSEE